MDPWLVTNRKCWRLWCLLLAIGTMLFIYQFYLNGFRRKEPDFGSLDFAEKPIDEIQLKERIIQAVKASQLAGSMFDVDVIHHHPNATFLLLQLDRSDFIKAPRNWCYKNVEQTNAPISADVKKCFSEVVLPDYPHVKATLRLIRDSLVTANITVVISIGSLLGSLRYQKKMPYDTDFDLLVHQTDRDKALQVVLSLAADPLHRMRLFDLKPVNLSAKIGLACAPDTTWMNPDRWSGFGGGVQFRHGVPTGLKTNAYRAMLGTCAIHMDLVSNAEVNDLLEKINEYAPLYRPLDGTLFRVFRGARKYLEECYNASLEICIPKIPRMLPGGMQNLPKLCRGMKVPCSMLDVLYPRVTQFIDASGNYEVGMEVDNKAECWIHSVFHYRS